MKVREGRIGEITEILAWYEYINDVILDHLNCRRASLQLLVEADHLVLGHLQDVDLRLVLLFQELQAIQFILIVRHGMDVCDLMWWCCLPLSSQVQRHSLTYYRSSLNRPSVSPRPGRMGPSGTWRLPSRTWREESRTWRWRRRRGRRRWTSFSGSMPT